MKFPDLSKYAQTHQVLLSWPFLVIYYLIFRMFTGLSYGIIYGFILLLLLFRVSFEKLALIFLLMGMVVYLFGRDTEANHYLSFFYGFLFLVMIKHFRQLLKK